MLRTALDDKDACARGFVHYTTDLLRIEVRKLRNFFRFIVYHYLTTYDNTLHGTKKMKEHLISHPATN